MKKNRISKLHISRETLRNLTDSQLNGVAGGMICTRPCGATTVSYTEAHSNCTNECCTNECTATC